MKYYLGGSVRRGGVLYYLHTDHLGSASLTTDASGNRVGELRYKPYGETRYIWGIVRTDRRFTGQVEDAAIGLYFYNARYYDPLLARFLSADTVVPEPGNPQALNRFAYVLGNPLRHTDPTGRFTKDEIMASLTDQYGEEMAKKIFDLWWNYDPGFMQALHDADFGWDIWVSGLADQIGGKFATFEQDPDHPNRILARWRWSDGTTRHLQLSELQGWGYYQVRGPDSYVPDNASTCYALGCMQGRFIYNDAGIVGDEPIYVHRVLVERYMFGMSMHYWDSNTSITIAPWTPTAPESEHLVLFIGLFHPLVGVVDFFNSVEYHLYPLTVSVDWQYAVNTADGLPMERYADSSVFSPGEWKP